MCGIVTLYDEYRRSILTFSAEGRKRQYERSTASADTVFINNKVKKFLGF